MHKFMFTINAKHIFMALRKCIVMKTAVSWAWDIKTLIYTTITWNDYCVVVLMLVYHLQLVPFQLQYDVFLVAFFLFNFYCYCSLSLHFAFAKCLFFIWLIILDNFYRINETKENMLLSLHIRRSFKQHSNIIV